jgi:parallel beta-helix repeat protein
MHPRVLLAIARTGSTLAAACIAAAFVSACGGNGADNPQIATAAAASGAGKAHATGMRALAVSGYYVDSATGSDANAGTSSAAPFRTLSKLTTLHLRPGEGIFLRCGSVWHESSSLGSTQLVDGSVITGYGDNCSTAPPRITGANDFSGGWTAGANGIWSRSVPAGTPKIARLFFNESPFRTAQWPNYTGPGVETKPASSSATSSNTMLKVATADVSTLVGKDVIGAAALIHTEAWEVENRTISAFDPVGGTLTISTPSQYAMGATTTYALQDKLWMLDAPGEFFHDTTNNVLYMVPWSAQVAAGINTARIEGSVRDTGMSVGYRTALNVTGIRIDMTRVTGLVVNDSRNARLSQLTLSHNARSGLRIGSSSPATGTDRNATLDQSKLWDNGLMAVDASLANRVTVSNSSIADTGTLGWSGNSLAALTFTDGGIATGNSLARTGYAAIRFAGGDNSTVSSNTIVDYCLRLSDCGAIYTWFGTSTTTSPYAQASTVTNNRISGNVLGGGSLLVAGIYLDDFSRGTTVQGNTVVGGGFGIYVHNGSHHTITGNQLWQNTAASIAAGMDQIGIDAMTSNVYAGNVLAPANTATGTFPALPQYRQSYAIKFSTTAPDLASVTSGCNLFQGNQIYALQSGSAPVVWTRAGSSYSLLTARAWNVLAPADIIAMPPAQYAVVKPILGAEMETHGSYDAGLTGWGAWYANSPGGSLGAVTHMGCVGTCAAFATTGASDSMAGATLSLTSNAMYAISYSNHFDQAATIAMPYVGMAAAPYSNMVLGGTSVSYLNAVSGSPGDDIDVQMLFVSGITAGGKANLKVATPGVSVYFDNVSVRPVTGYSVSVASAWSAAATAPLGTSKSFDCVALGWTAGCSAMDLNGTPIALPVVVPAGSTRLLLRSDSPFRN